MKINKKNTILIVFSSIVSLLSIFMEGLIRINHQDLSPVMNTYSGRFPVSWFEYYYPTNVVLSFEYIFNNFNNHYNINPFTFIVNTLVILSILRWFEKIILKVIKILNK